MKTYKDIFAVNGIAKIFEENFSTDFENFFAENTAAAVDLYVVERYGEKTLKKSITENNAVQIVCAIIQIYLEVWRKIYDALTVSYNIAENVNEVKTKVGTVARENIDLNAQKAFNDTAFTDDTRNTANGVETYDLTETRNEIDANVISNVNREIEMRKRQNLRLDIIDTIISNLCLTIYY